MEWEALLLLSSGPKPMCLASTHQAAPPEGPTMKAIVAADEQAAVGEQAAPPEVPATQVHTGRAADATEGTTGTGDPIDNCATPRPAPLLRAPPASAPTRKPPTKLHVRVRSSARLAKQSNPIRASMRVQARISKAFGLIEDEKSFDKGVLVAYEAKMQRPLLDAEIAALSDLCGKGMTAAVLLEGDEMAPIVADLRDAAA
ncbi:hypothetical protein ACP70R_039628 [Stipagrostis hirtigluma subsp. patula]